MAKHPQHQLLPDVRAKYRATIVPTRIELQWLGRTIDLRTLTLAEADKLVADERFTFLVAKRGPRAKAQPPRAQQKA